MQRLHHLWVIYNDALHFSSLSATDFLGKFYCLYFVFMVIFTCHFEYLLILLVLL